MPVVGLPTTVEVALGSLLAEKTVSSWKITGQGDTTVVVLRLRSDKPVQDGGDSMEQCNNNVYYRRKNPSQLRRDRQRAAERRQQTLEASELNPIASPFSPSIEKGLLFVDTDIDRPTGSDNATPTFTCDLPKTADDVASLPHSDVPSVYVDNHVGLAAKPTQRPLANVFGAETVKEYVGGIFNKMKLRNLRDTKRNTKFNVVCQVGTDRVVCRSDDVVIVVDSETGNLKYWFILQHPNHMREDEKAWLQRMHGGTQVDRDKRLIVSKAEQDLLPTLMDMITFFLG
jgi:hypothetical protein